MVAQEGRYYGTLFKIHQGGKPGGYPIPHHLKHGGGCSDSSLGHSGSRRGGDNGRFWTGDPMAGNVILLWWWDPCLYQDGLTEGGTIFIYGAVWQGCSPYQCQKTVGMICQPSYMAGGHSEEEYSIKVTGVGPYFRERQWGQFHCPEWAADLSTGLLVAHHWAKHGMMRALQWAITPTPPDPGLYRVSLHRAAGSVWCPLGVCKG